MSGERAPQRHNLKTWPKWFDAVASGRKTFEVRFNDRNFREGDELQLCEWDPETGEYTGLECRRRISFVYGEHIESGFVVLGLVEPPPAPGVKP